MPLPIFVFIDCFLIHNILCVNLNICDLYIKYCALFFAIMKKIRYICGRQISYELWNLRNMFLTHTLWR